MLLGVIGAAITTLTPEQLCDGGGGGSLVLQMCCTCVYMRKFNSRNDRQQQQ